MSALTFRGEPGVVYMRDGAYREVPLTDAQCDVLLDVWEQTEARTTYNDLTEACQRAGFIPRVSCLRVAATDPLVAA